MAGDSETQSVIKLSNSKVLYLREVNKYLCLVCLLKSDIFEKQGSYFSRLLHTYSVGLIDYNFTCLKSAISEVYEVGKRAQLNIVNK
jgi:Ras-related GTP-binding protein C/D